MSLTPEQRDQVAAELKRFGADLLVVILYACSLGWPELRNGAWENTLLPLSIGNLD